MGRKIIPCAVCGSERHDLLFTASGNRGLDYIEQEHPVVVCASCGLTYLNPQHEDGDYRRYYSKSDYQPITLPPKKFLARHSYRRIQAAYLIDTLRSLFSDRPAAEVSVLDVGCGPGVLLHYLKEAGFQTTGLESSPIAADYARNSLGLHIETGSIFDRSLPDASFDVVVSTAAIEHFTDPLAAVLEMKRMLRPGGIMYLNTPDLRGMVLKKGTGNWFKFVHTYYFTEASLTNLMRKAGLSIARNWTMPPLLQATWLYPGNYCSGELNIVARKQVAESTETSAPLRRETLQELQADLAAALQRDRIHAAFRDLYRHPITSLPRRVLARLIKPKDVFSSYFRPDQSVDTTQFPPPLPQALSASR